MSGKDNQYVYYNVRMINDLDADPLVYFKPAVFSETRVLPILHKPSDYELAVVRFKLPLTSIPLYIYEDILRGGLSYDGAEVEAQLLPPSNNVFIYGLAYYTYQEIADAINDAYKVAYDALVILKPALAVLTTGPPFITFDGQTKLYTIWADEGWNDELLNPPRAYASSALGRFFVRSLSSDTNLNASSDSYIHIIRIKNNFTNTETVGGINYLKMEQFYSTTQLISTFTNIVFQTDRIPVSGEYLTSTQKDQNNLLISSTGSNVTRHIITDFEPIDSIQNNSNIQYFPQGPLRYYPLNNDEEMRTVDVKIFWEDHENRLFPVYLAPGDIATVKLQFRRRKEILLREQMYDNDLSS